MSLNKIAVGLIRRSLQKKAIKDVQVQCQHGLQAQIANCQGVASQRQFSSDSFPTDPDDLDGLQESARTSYGEKSVNSVTLLGRVGIHPQMRGSEEHPVVSFTLATTIRYKPKNSSFDELVSKTDWHNVAVFKPLLRESVYETVMKGNRVMVQGRIMYGTVEDKKTGQIRTTTTIVAEDVIRFKS